MTNMNEVIAQNISSRLSQIGKKQADLANFLNLPKQTISKMINGTRMISAPELSQIADFCKTSMESLVSIPINFSTTNPLKVFMGEVKTDGGSKGIKTADELINIYIFHSKYQSDEFKQNCSKEWSDE